MRLSATRELRRAELTDCSAGSNPADTSPVYSPKELKDAGISLKTSELARAIDWIVTDDPKEAVISLDWLRKNDYDELLPENVDEIATTVERFQTEDPYLAFCNLLGFKELPLTEPLVNKLKIIGSVDFSISAKGGVKIWATLLRIAKMSVSTSHNSPVCYVDADSNTHRSCADEKEPL